MREGVEVCFPFITITFSERNYPHCPFSGFGINHNHAQDAAQQAKCDPTFLSVIKTLVKLLHDRTIKNLMNIGKVESVLTDIEFVLYLIPSVLLDSTPLL